MALTKEDIKTIKGVVIEGVNEGISQLIIPQLDNIYTRLDGVENRLGGVEERLDGVDEELENLVSGQDQILRRLTHKQDQLDNHVVMLENHEKRIAQLEFQPAF